MTAYGAGVDPYSAYYQHHQHHQHHQHQHQHQHQPALYPGPAAPAPSALGAAPVAVPATWCVGRGRGSFASRDAAPRVEEDDDGSSGGTPHDAYQQQAAPGAAGYFAYPQQAAAYSDPSAGAYTSAAPEPDVPPGVAPQTQSAATWYQTQTQQQQQQQQQQQSHAEPYYAGYAQYHPPPHQYAAPSAGPQVYAAYSQPVVNYQAPPVIYPQPYDSSAYAQPTYSAGSTTIVQPTYSAGATSIVQPTYSAGATSIVQPTPAEVNYYYQPTPPLPTSPQPGTAPVSPQKALSSPRKPGTAPVGVPQAKPDAVTKAKPSVGAAKPSSLPSRSQNPRPQQVGVQKLRWLSPKIWPARLLMRRWLQEPAYLSVKSKKKVALGDAFDLPSSAQSGATSQETTPQATSQNGVPVAAPEDTSLKQPKVKKKSDQIEWPEALKGYVSRAFASCEGNRDAVEKELH
ncbi:MAG: hypothetical protein BJ554DRAFT_4947, partial [Olpidium bornovanus]